MRSFEVYHEMEKPYLLHKSSGDMHLVTDGKKSILATSFKVTAYCYAYYLKHGRFPEHEDYLEYATGGNPNCDLLN